MLFTEVCNIPPTFITWQHCGYVNDMSDLNLTTDRSFCSAGTWRYVWAAMVQQLNFAAILPRVCKRFIPLLLFYLVS